MNKTISAANAPAAVGPYCHAKLAGNTLYTSGQLGLVPATGALPEGVEAVLRGEGDSQVRILLNHNEVPVHALGQELAPFQVKVLPVT